MNRDEGELILSSGYDPFLNGSTHSIVGVTRGIDQHYSETVNLELVFGFVLMNF